MNLGLRHKAIRDLEQAGAQAWLVGGCVRDSLLERPIADIDIACSFPWEQSRDILENAGWYCFETGTKHGTITAIWPRTKGELETLPAEITSFRTEGAYSDFRHPDAVTVAKTIEEDLARRDFTINALAYHQDRGLLDIYGGLQDLNAGIIRAVGNPNERFKEDPLRILRACRFSSQLGFDIEQSTFYAMLADKELLVHVSQERIFKELSLLLCGNYAHDALMKCATILFVILPELESEWEFKQNTPYHSFDVYEHAAWAVQHCPAKPELRFAALLHDCGKPHTYTEDENGIGHFKGHAKISEELSRKICKRLKMPTDVSQKIITLVKNHDRQIEPTARVIKRILHSFDGDVELFKDLCMLQRADAIAKHLNVDEGAKKTQQLLDLLEEVLTQSQAFSLKDLSVSGKDLLAWGFEQGPTIGAALNAALDAVINEEIPNEPEAIRKFLEE